jgi:tRNA A-37 threonylcarbamoyl transferase component Bud32
MTETEGSRLVKPPQSRDGHGVSAVYLEPGDRWGRPDVRVYAKRQHAYHCRPVWRLFRRTPTLRRELRALRACRALGIPVPEIIAYRESGPEAELVVAEVRDGRALHAALADHPASRERILDLAADVIAHLHRAGWTHGALYPQHVLVGPAPECRVTLIDLEKARRSRLKRRRDLDRLLRYLTPHLVEGEADRLLERYLETFSGSAND